MNISLEDLISLVTKEVIKELHKRGIQIDSSIMGQQVIAKEKVTSKKMDFTGYITPLVTEEKIIELDDEIKEIIVPKNTIITPSAMDLIKKRQININKCNNYK